MFPRYCDHECIACQQSDLLTKPCASRKQVRRHSKYLNAKLRNRFHCAPKTGQTLHRLWVTFETADDSLCRIAVPLHRLDRHQAVSHFGNHRSGGEARQLLCESLERRELFAVTTLARQRRSGSEAPARLPPAGCLEAGCWRDDGVEFGDGSLALR